MLRMVQIINSSFLKVYLATAVIFSLVFISFNILAQVEDSPYVLREYLKGQACPHFINKNTMTMKDECTGLVWARYEMPTYTQTKDALETNLVDPGYDWQGATTACANLAKVNGVSIFRLPTAEELLTLLSYQCINNECSASLADSALDLNGDDTADMNPPFFSEGRYWSSSDFREDPSWTSPSSIPVGKSSRDYKRSVNLTNGEVDNPVFNKDMRLNAWCIVDHTQEVQNIEFTQTNSVNVAGTDGTTVGAKVTEGNVRVNYNRTCQVKSDCDSIGTGLTVNCDTTSGLCYQDIYSVPVASKITSCLTGYHVEGDTCVGDALTTNCWRGNAYNGIYGCEIFCGDGIKNGFEECDTLDGVATGPADSSATREYACDGNCKLTGGYCGDGFKQSIEGCDGTANVSTTPSGSSISKQYSCTATCTPTGGYFGDGIINGPEICDSALPNQACMAIYNNPGHYCNGRSIPGSQSCNSSGLWNACSVSLPTVDSDGDGKVNYCDNCDYVVNPLQEDADNDGIGDFCDTCFNYPANGPCVTLTATQASGGTFTFNPYAMKKSVVTFYDYDPGRSSATIVDYPIVASDRSEILAYINVPTDSSVPMMSLIMVHDSLSSNNVGDADFNFSGSGWDMGIISVRDDVASEFDKDSTPGRWHWEADHTDGGVLDIANLNTSWSITIDPISFNKITSWIIKTPGDVNAGQALNMNEPVTISYTAQ